MVLTPDLLVIDDEIAEVVDALLEFSEQEVAEFIYMWLCSRTDVVFKLVTRDDKRHIVENSRESAYAKLDTVLHGYKMPFDTNYAVYLIRKYRILDWGELAKW